MKNPRVRAGDELKRMFDACKNRYGKRPLAWSRDRHEPGMIANYRFK